MADASRSNKNKSILPHVSTIILFSLIGIGMIVAYFVFLQMSTGAVEDSLKTCSNNDKHASDFIDTKPIRLDAWVLNLSNPLEYLNGETADFHEIGSYGFRIDTIRANPEFSKKEGTFSYDSYYDVADDTARTCSGCSHQDLVNVPNYGYATLLGNSKNEGGLLLALTCTATQIALMTSTSPIPYCSTNQRGNSSVNCRCCRTSPLAPAGGSFCQSILTPTSRAGGMMSYLSQHDHGVKLSSKSTAFVLSNGIYSSMVRQLTVNEVLWGHGSALIGSISTAQALAAGAGATSAQISTIQANAVTTRDLIDACYVNSTTCPSISTLANGNPFLFKFAECKGRVPSPEILIERGLSSRRAQQLRYLEGVSCQPLTSTIVLAAVLQKDVAPSKSWQCADGSTSLPCCLSSFHSYTFGLHGSGTGCVQWIGGLIQIRRVYSDEEALTTLGPLQEKVPPSDSLSPPPPLTLLQMGTVCAPKDDRFQILMYKGLTSSLSWYIPPNDHYPNLTWADNTLMKPGLTPTGPGQYVYTNLSGELFSIHNGKGFKPQFLSDQLTKDAKPLADSLTVWVAFRRSTVEFQHTKETVYKAVTTNAYRSLSVTTTDPTEREKQQKQGMTPYQNMASLYYASGGRPLIMSSPNFFGSDPIVLTQTDNRQRLSNLTTGINIFQTRDGYQRDAALLSSPRQMTTETWDQNVDSFSGHLLLEPATGLTLSGSLVNQFSTLSWNCNPKIDATCGMFFYNKTASRGRLCYRSGTNYFPCSAANVFTPRVMGGKVLPVFWMRASPTVPSTVLDALHGLQRKAFVSGVLVLVVPIVSLFVVLALVMSLLSHKKQSQQITQVIEMKPINQETGTGGGV